MPPTIRLATLDDAEQVQAIYAPYCFTPISFEMEPPSVEEMRGRLAKVLGHYPWLVCEEAGEVLGYAYAMQHRERAAYRWSVDTSVYVRRAVSGGAWDGPCTLHSWPCCRCKASATPTPG